MIQWKDTSPKICWPLSDNTKLLSAPQFILMQLGLVKPYVVVSAYVQAQVLAHLQTSHVEQGGLLIGKVSRLTEATPEDQFELIEVLQACPAQESQGTALSLRMESSVWESARAICEKNTDCRVVGWYHSHPNLGAFFSHTDRQTQAAFFSHAYSLGWVIDPATADNQNLDQAWFIGANSAPTQALVY